MIFQGSAVREGSRKEDPFAVQKRNQARRAAIIDINRSLDSTIAFFYENRKEDKLGGEKEDNAFFPKAGRAIAGFFSNMIEAKKEQASEMISDPSKAVMGRRGSDYLAAKQAAEKVQTGGKKQESTSDVSSSIFKLQEYLKERYERPESITGGKLYASIMNFQNMTPQAQKTILRTLDKSGVRYERDPAMPQGNTFIFYLDEKKK